MPRFAVPRFHGAAAPRRQILTLQAPPIGGSTASPLQLFFFTAFIFFCGYRARVSLAPLLSAEKHWAGSGDLPPLPTAPPAHTQAQELVPRAPPACNGVAVAYVTTLERGARTGAPSMRPLISLDSWFTLGALANGCGEATTVFYDPADFPGAGPLVGGAAVAVDGGGSGGERMLVLPPLRYATVSFDSLAGRWLRPHSSGRHIAMRGLALFASLALCTGTARPAVLARFHDGARVFGNPNYVPPDTGPENESPPTTTAPPIECASLLAVMPALVAAGELLVYVRPGLSPNGFDDRAARAALAGGLAPLASGTSALHFFPAPPAVLGGHHSCLLGEDALEWPQLSRAMPAEVARRFRADMLDPRLDAAQAPLLGALALAFSQGVPPTWDAAVLSAALGCLREEACAAGRGNLAVFPALRGETILAAATLRAEDIFSALVSANGSGTSPLLSTDEGAQLQRLPARVSCYHNAVAAFRWHGAGGGATTSAITFAVDPACPVAGPPPPPLLLEHWSAAQGAPLLSPRAPVWEGTLDGDGGERCWGGAPGSARELEARRAHREWTPAWSGFTSAEAAAAGATHAPPAWGDPHRKTFAHLVMGQAPHSIRPLATALAAPNTAVVVGCWGVPAADCAVLEAEGVATLTQSLEGTSFSVGRNKNGLRVAELELRFGRLFEYVVHWDEDMVLEGACAPGGGGTVPTEDLVHTAAAVALHGPGQANQAVEAGGAQPPTAGAPCLRALEAWALALLPAIMVPNLGYGEQSAYIAQRVYNFDSQSTYLHRRAVDALLPYETMFERYSYYSGPSLLQHIVGTVYRDAVVSMQTIFARNPQHREYPKGVGYGLHCSMGVKWFVAAEGLVPASALSLVRWDCAPNYIWEGEEAAAATWGSLDWLEKRGRAGKWSRPPALSVDVQGVPDFGAAGVVGGPPRAEPPYSSK